MAKKSKTAILRQYVKARLETLKLKKARKVRVKMMNFLADHGMSVEEIAEMTDTDVIDCYQQLKEMVKD